MAPAKSVKPGAPGGGAPGEESEGGCPAPTPPAPTSPAPAPPACGFSKTDLIVISIKQFEFTMAKHEVARLAETLAETMSAVAKSYELGLYL